MLTLNLFKASSVASRANAKLDSNAQQVDDLQSINSKANAENELFLTETAKEIKKQFEKNVFMPQLR